MTVVARFAIEYLCVLDADAKLCADPPALATDDEKLLDLYQQMVFLRTFDTKAIALQRTGKLGTYASCLGHEAAHVAIGTAMQPEDVFCPMYREYGAQFARGVKPHEVLLYWGGDERGSNFSGAQHDFPWCVPIATQCLHAAGAAMAFKLRDEPRVAVSVVGDGGTSKTDFYGAINVAGAFNLPLVTVIVNNQWAISVPRDKQTAAQTLAQKGIAAGIACRQVDGNDLIAMRVAMDEAVAQARSGGGPTLIEAVTYRLSDHTTADDARRYRPAEELEEAQAKEPLRRMRRYLSERGVWDDDKEAAFKRECAQRVDAEVDAYLAVKPPPISDIFDYLYDDMPASLQAQRTRAVAIEGGAA